MTNIQFVTEKVQAYPFLFSICTIVNKMDEYMLMKKSFEDCGFTGGCEYLVADNTEENRFDAYTAYAAFMKQSKGRYIIAVHQDVHCIERREKLIECLEIINNADKKWALCGNAGCNGFHQKRMHMINAGKKITCTNLPARVNSLDENFIIINAKNNISLSADLTGFHLYGTDICLVADFLGYTSYVIPFMVNHLSKGDLGTLEKFIPQFSKAYSRKLRSRYIETSCTRFYLAGGLRNSILNMWPVIEIIKITERIKQFILTLKGKNNYKKQVETIN